VTGNKELIETETKTNPPEFALWLAVIDKAVLDYVKHYKYLPPGERSILRWFLFCKDPKPNNLAFLCENLFDEPDITAKIRGRIHKLKSGELPITGLDDNRKRYVPGRH
jgi:hypothetical protein